jgi:ketosteroid isomerase-like protein
MSEENVAKIRAWIEAYNRRDYDTALRDFDPDIEWVLPDHQSSDSGHGTAAVMRFLDGIDEIFDEMRLEAQEFVDEGDRVATRLHHCARGKGSGIEIDAELYHQVATFRDGRIVRMEYVTTWPDALKALAR